MPLPLSSETGCLNILLSELFIAEDQRTNLLLSHALHVSVQTLLVRCAPAQGRENEWMVRAHSLLALHQETKRKHTGRFCMTYTIQNLYSDYSIF